MRSIRGRLLATLLTGLALVLGAGGTAVYLTAARSLTGQFDAALEARAHTVASLVKLEPPARLVWEISDAPAVPMDETFFELRDPARGVLKRSDNLGADPLPQRTPAENAVEFGDLDLAGAIRGRAAWLTFRPRVDPEDWEGRDIAGADPPLLVVTAALDRTPVDRALARLLAALLALGTGVGVTAGLLIVLGVRWGLAPLNRLSRQLAAVGGDDLSRRFDGKAAPRELAPVYDELNRMLQRVERTIERERTFADAAAHELRTPLAELRTAAEVALRWPDLDRAEPALREALAIGREMECLVDSLLLISRGHAASSWDGARAASLGPIVRGCLKHADESIAAKGLAVAVTLNGGETLAAPADAVEIIVRNLIDNAVQYTPARGTILIGNGHAGHEAAALFVENGPVELVAGDVPRLFEPFWRREGARTDRRHSGLGLAVVDHIARAIGLRVEAELAGDRLRIRLAPAASAATDRAAPSAVAADGEQ